MPVYNPNTTVQTDAAGAWLVGELERLYPKLYEPLASVTFHQHLQFRPDIGMWDEFHSFARIAYAAPGAGQLVTNWSDGIGTEVLGIDVETEKLVGGIKAWRRKLSYSVEELQKSIQLNRPLDQQKLAALMLAYSMDMDRMAYVGDVGAGFGGLFNAAEVTNLAPVANGAGGTPDADSKTPEEILGDVNEVIQSAWEQSAYTSAPETLLISPRLFTSLNRRLMPGPVAMSVLTYLKDNTLLNRLTGKPLDIQPVKWAAGIGAGGSDRMTAYTNDVDKVRMIGMVPQPLGQLEIKDAAFHQHYRATWGGLEIVYPETMAYRDGL